MRALVKLCALPVILGIMIQSADASESAAGALRSLSDISNRLKTRTAESTEIVQMTADIEDLKQLYGSPGAEVSKEYANTLALDAQLLQEALGTADGNRARALISNVASDISIKHQFALSATPQFAGKPPTLVDVTVNVKRDGRPLSGYAVRWWSALWTNRPPIDEFNGDPLEGRIPPGRYITAAVKDGNIVVRQPKSVGLTGRTKESIDLILP